MLEDKELRVTDIGNMDPMYLLYLKHDMEPETGPNIIWRVAILGVLQSCC